MGQIEINNNQSLFEDVYAQLHKHARFTIFGLILQVPLIFTYFSCSNMTYVAYLSAARKFSNDGHFYDMRLSHKINRLNVIRIDTLKITTYVQILQSFSFA